ncbi:ATP-binding protein [Chondrinema litorale]|uniref:ATP-binding protein n=1 Tax=Chondrinema litorale TaxID=2994555 RepID=UPI002542C2E0|nr:ATP-binding protein [Chondrinema litorale]UZS00006.1 ATP-binding protein [Chondrinema litorale]
MQVFNTEMHIVTFIITSIEVVILFYISIHYLQRPSDNKRKWYLILLILLICYNLAGSLFPDERFFLPVIFQYVISYLTGVVMSIFFAYYVYKYFQLESMKFIATKGAFYFIGLPYILLFAIPYSITGNFELFNKLVVIVPFFYGVAFIIFAGKAFKGRYAEVENIEDRNYFKESLITVYISMVFWMSMPVVTYIKGSQVLEHSLTNIGFLIMSFSYVRTSIYTSKKEYREHKEFLEKSNEELKLMVKEKTEELRKTLDQKTNTLINLAHELKSPLTLALIYMEQYEAKYGTSKEFDVMKKNIKKIARDVINFFDLEKFNKGIDVYNHQQVSSATEILNSTIELFLPMAAKKGIKILDCIEDELFISIDPSAFQRVINNLIENAIRYSYEDSEIEVLLKAENHEVIFSVKDHGIGIRRYDLKNIFKPYFQLNTRKRNNEGMGMGLSIVKQIVKSVDGEIKVESEQGEGATFSICFYRHSFQGGEYHAASPTKNIISVDVDKPEVKDIVYDDDRPSILIVEDNLELLNFMSNKLSEFYNVYVATNGAMALEKLDTNISVDLIISDIMMDVIDGYELYKYVAGAKRYRHIPFIFLTAKSDENTKLNGLKMGAIDYIEKPFKIDEVNQKIKSILNTFDKQRNALINQVYKSINSNNKADNEKLDWREIKENNFNDNCEKFGFTAREKEIAKDIISGKTYKTIADKLCIADATVKKHVANLYNKAEVKSKYQLIKKMESSF